MSFLKYKKRIISFAAILIFLAILIISLFFFFDEPPLTSYIDYKDNISSIKLYDIGGSAYQLDTTKKKFMIFLSKDCGSCIELLPELQKINTVFCIDQNIDFLLLWENQIPTNDVQKFGLSEHSYSLDNVRISSTFDTVYYVNEKNEVQLVDNHGGFDNILRLITEDTLFDRTIMIKSANKYIVKYMSEQKQYPQLIYFSLPGCPDCENADEIVHSDEVSNRFHVTRIERDKNAASEDLIDKNDVFRFVYDIDWYPSFLIINSDESWKIIRELEVDELKTSILAP